MNEGTWKSLHLQTNCVIRCSIKGHEDIALIPNGFNKYRILSSGKILESVKYIQRFNKSFLSTSKCESCAFVKFNCTCCGAPLTAREFVVPRTMRFRDLLLWHEFAEHGTCDIFDRRVLIHERKVDSDPRPEDIERVIMSHEWANVVELVNRWRFVK